jgi:hypothetical protein
MNRNKLSQSRWKRFRLHPIARRIARQGVELERIDDSWLVTDSSKDSLSLQNPRSGQNVDLGLDHVREYMTDPTGRSDGFLILKSQVFLHDPRGFSVQPLIHG